jgi:hypothetical protein
MRERTAPETPLDLPGHSAPAVGFEVPLEMLAACHGRVQTQCATLRRLAAHLTTHGADRQPQESRCSAASEAVRLAHPRDVGPGHDTRSASETGPVPRLRG